MGVGEPVGDPKRPDCKLHHLEMETYNLEMEGISDCKLLDKFKDVAPHDLDFSATVGWTTGGSVVHTRFPTS